MKYAMQKALLILFLNSTSFAFGQASWNILLYLDSSDQLSHVMLKNVHDLIRGYQANDNADLAIYIQWHCLPLEGDVGCDSYRFQVTKEGLKIYEPVNLTYDSTQDLIAAAQWGLCHRDADHYMLIMGNHGLGILNPSWSEAESDWVPEHDKLMEYNKKRSVLVQKKFRALMLQVSPKVYMTNANLQEALSTITTFIPKEKLDILGFDMCLMSMLEVADDIAPYADFMIASQEVELEYGWDYYEIFKNFNSKYTSPADITKSIVKSYADFYTTELPDNFYTLTSIDLSRISKLKEITNFIACNLLDCMNLYGQSFKNELQKARETLSKFILVPMYTDLYEFFEAVEYVLDKQESSDAQQDLKNNLVLGKALLNQAVVAHAAGSANEQTHGISIYLPLSHVDTSYPTTLFGENSSWLSFLNSYIMQ